MSLPTHEPTYMDYNATTPLAAEARAAIMDALDHWGNPTSSNALGVAAKRVVERARAQLARALAVEPRCVVFTSGGSETNNLVAMSALAHHKAVGGGRKLHVISSAMEHPSVLAKLQELSGLGEISLHLLASDPTSGCIDLAQLQRLLPTCACDPLFVSLLMANGETGVIQPIARAAALLKAHTRGVLLHSDASQCVGKMRVDMQSGADVLTVAGHKFYGPRVGAMVMRADERVRRLFERFPLVSGGGQEMGIRAGTQNTPMLAGLGAAAQLVADQWESHSLHMLATRDHFERQLKARPSHGQRRRRRRCRRPSAPRWSSTSSARSGSATPAACASRACWPPASSCWPRVPASSPAPAPPATPTRRAPRPPCWPAAYRSTTRCAPCASAQGGTPRASRWTR